MERGEELDKFEFSFESLFNSKVREQVEAERRRGEAELRSEMRREVEKLREEVAEVQVFIMILISPIILAGIHKCWEVDKLAELLDIISDCQGRGGREGSRDRGKGKEEQRRALLEDKFQVDFDCDGYYGDGFDGNHGDEDGYDDKNVLGNFINKSILFNFHQRY